MRFLTVFSCFLDKIYMPMIYRNILINFDQFERGHGTEYFCHCLAGYAPLIFLLSHTRLDIGSDRGAEDRPKLFPIMCVILRKNRIEKFEFANLDSNFLKVGLKILESKKTLSQLRNKMPRSFRQLCDF